MGGAGTSISTSVDDGSDAPLAVPTGEAIPVQAGLVAMLAAEAADLREHFAVLSAAMGDPGLPDARYEAIEACADEIQRLAVAAGAVGLEALAEALSRVQFQVIDLLGQDALSDDQTTALADFSDLLLAYLQAPDGVSGGGIAASLAGPTWSEPLPPVEAASLAARLAAVQLVDQASAAPARQTLAAPADVSLQYPPDIDPELLDGLLHELPRQTADFAAAVQRLVTGGGDQSDLEVAKRAAHTLKGAAHTVGIMGVANLTHHLEDILIALAEASLLPHAALAESLLSASDCLEAMCEAVLATGPAPEDALTTLQQVLDWANRIDREGPQVLHGGAAPAAAPGAATPSVVHQDDAPEQAENQVRVPSRLLDELLRLVGETIISTSQVHERLRNVGQHNDSVRTHSDSVMQIATELENLVEIHGVGAPLAARRHTENFDPLEFEHYSELHTVSRKLVESANDGRHLGAGIEEALGALYELVNVQNRLHKECQDVIMRTRMIQAKSTVARLQRSLRQIGRLLDKQVELHVTGGETLIDGNVLADLMDPLMHVLRNSADHGIEDAATRAARGKPAAGRIDLSFSKEGNLVVIRCQDDGAGLDLERIRQAALDKGLIRAGQVLSEDELAHLILAPGFSTRDEVTQVSGRGIGMDVVNSQVQHLKGSIELHSMPGQGLRIELRVPAVLISTHALLLRVGAQLVAVSSHGILDLHYASAEQVQEDGEGMFYQAGTSRFPASDLAAYLNLGEERRSRGRGSVVMLLVRLDSGNTHAVRVQQVVDSRDLVVKNFGRYVPKIEGLVGAAILGDGSVAPVVDLPELLRPRRMLGAPAALPPELPQDGPQRPRALVVDDSFSARRATAQLMRDAGFDVRTAIDGVEAIGILEKWMPQVLLVDMEMPRLNGLELSMHLRSYSPTSRVPIIMITSRSTEKHRRMAESAGIDVYLTKPFRDDELLGHVTRLTAN